MPSLGPHGYAIEIGRGATGPCPMLTTVGDCMLPINHGGPHSDGKWTDLGRSPRRKRSYKDRGLPGAPRYHSMDDFYPVEAELARRLAWVWRRSGESARGISCRTGAPESLVAEAIDFPRETAPRIIAHFRGIGTSRETLDKHRQLLRLVNPDLRSKRDVDRYIAEQSRAS